MNTTIRKGFKLTYFNINRYQNQTVLYGIIAKQLNTSPSVHLSAKNNIIDSKRLKFMESKFFGHTTFNYRQQRYTIAAVNTQQINKKKMTKLTDQERTELLQPLLDAGWSIVNDRDAIHKEYLFGDFNQAFSFMSGAALLAEKMNHHPEWFNVYNKVQVTMSTHDVGGLSAKDIRMAKYMEEHSKRFL